MKTSPSQGTFQEEFERRLTGIKTRGAELGLSMSHICREGGASRGTPERWKTQIPLTILLIDAMEKVVIDAEKKEREQKNGN